MAKIWDGDFTSSPAELLVLLSLADQANDEDFSCWPSWRYLMLRTKLSRRTISRHLGDFEERGLLKKEIRERENGSRRSNLYFLTLDKDDKKDKKDLSIKDYVCLVLKEKQRNGDLIKNKMGFEKSIIGDIEANGWTDSRTRDYDRLKKIERRMKDIQESNNSCPTAGDMKVIESQGFQEFGKAMGKT